MSLLYSASAEVVDADTALLDAFTEAAALYGALCHLVPAELQQQLPRRAMYLHMSYTDDGRLKAILAQPLSEVD